MAVAATIVAAAAPAAATVYPGHYDAKGKAIKAKLEVGQSGGSTLAYAMRSACGRSRGKVELSKSGAGLKGRRVSRGPESSVRTTVAKVALSRSGEQVVGTIKESLGGGGGKLAGCRAKRTFTADVDQADGFVPTRDAGHYSGTAANGLPIGFDVVATGESVRVENLAVDVQADCFDATDPAGEELSMTTHIAGMSGRVASDGTFYIDYAPDDETEYEFDGALADAEAKVDVVIGGYFDAAGNPSASGPYYCDSWGDLYDAGRE